MKPEKNRKFRPAFDRDLSLDIDICGFKISSPTMLASGILGISFDLFPRIVRRGCGIIVTKSVSLNPREGYGNPTMTGIDGGYLNAIGLSNPGAEEFEKEMDVLGAKPVPLLVSIFEDSAERFAELAGRLDRPGILGFELNLSCPHVKDVGSEIGTDPSNAAEIVTQVKASTKKPVFAKMPATIPNVPEWAKMVETAGADAIVAINTIRAMKIDLGSRKPILSNKYGGLSGPAIKSVAVRSVYEIYENVRIPVIGVGGVTTAEDAVEFLLAGARAVQIGSAVSQNFLDIFSKINSGIGRYLIENSFSTAKELVGLAHN